MKKQVSRVKLSSGMASCHREPSGQHGLEGFNRGDSYRFERWKDTKGMYMRMYHSDDYYEAIGSKSFEKFFEIESETCEKEEA